MPTPPTTEKRSPADGDRDGDRQRVEGDRAALDLRELLRLRVLVVALDLLGDLLARPRSCRCVWGCHGDQSAARPSSVTVPCEARFPSPEISTTSSTAAATAQPASAPITKPKRARNGRRAGRRRRAPPPARRPARRRAGRADARGRAPGRPAGDGGGIRSRATSPRRSRRSRACAARRRRAGRSRRRRRARRRRSAARPRAGCPRG